jgi:hypothetical protein
MICVLTEVFDCVNHDILLRKLYYCEIHGASAHCLKTYQYRMQKVNISPQNQKEEFTSSWKAVERGVLQGSVRGPL